MSDITDASPVRATEDKAGQSPVCAKNGMCWKIDNSPRAKMPRSPFKRMKRGSPFKVGAPRCGALPPLDVEKQRQLMRGQYEFKEQRVERNRAQLLMEKTVLLALQHFEDDFIMQNVKEMGEIQKEILQEEIAFTQETAAHRRRALLEAKQEGLLIAHHYGNEIFRENRQSRVGQAKKMCQRQLRASKARERVQSAKTDRIADKLSRIALAKEQREKKCEIIRVKADARLREAEERRMKQQQEKLEKLKEHNKHLLEVRRRKAQVSASEPSVDDAMSE